MVTTLHKTKKMLTEKNAMKSLVSPTLSLQGMFDSLEELPDQGFNGEAYVLPHGVWFWWDVYDDWVDFLTGETRAMRLRLNNNSKLRDRSTAHD